MKYCGRFSNKIDMSVFDEISILYDNQDRQLLTFLEEHCDKRIVLIVRDMDNFYKAQEWLKLNAIKEAHPDWNFVVCFREICRFELFNSMLQECCANLCIPFFTGYLVTSFDQLHYLCAQGVSDVYLGEDICFDLRRAKAVASSYGVQLRVFPNVAQASVRTSPALKKFFIRPEDVSIYEDVIDTFEFWGPLDRQAVLYKIYSKERWFGDLQALILDFDMSFDSRRVLPSFASIRKTCGRKCMKSEPCSICDTIHSISKKFENQNLMLKNKYTH